MIYMHFGTKCIFEVVPQQNFFEGRLFRPYLHRANPRHTAGRGVDHVNTRTSPARSPPLTAAVLLPRPHGRSPSQF